MSKSILLFILNIFFIIPSFSQLVQTERFEMEIKRSDDPYYLIPADSNGMFIFHPTDERVDGNDRYDIIKLDRDLKKENEFTLFIDDKYNWLGHEYISPYLYLLYREGDSYKNDLHVIRVGESDDDIDRFDIKNEMEFDITHFQVCKNSAIMGGVVNSRPTLVLYNFDKKKITVLPGFYLKDSKLISLNVNVNETFNVLIYNEKNTRNRNLQLKVYDWQGNMLAEDEFDVPEDKSIYTGVTSKLVNEDLVITGTFGLSNSQLSEGLYWAKADLSKKQKIKLIPFSELGSFFDHLPEKRREKMKEKSESSSRDFVHKEHVIVQRLMEQGGKFYLLAEVFDPVYIKPQDIRNPYMYSSRYYPYSYSRHRYYNDLYNTQEFSNIKYLISIVAAMNKDGSILWDQGIVLDRVESEELEQISSLNISKSGEVALAYKDEDVFKYKIVDGQETIKGDTSVNIMLSQTTDILKDEDDEEGGIQYWYPGSFYAWGYQSIKRMTEDNNERLYVFYINKLEMDN